MPEHAQTPISGIRTPIEGMRSFLMLLQEYEARKNVILDADISKLSDRDVETMYRGILVLWNNGDALVTHIEGLENPLDEPEPAT